MWWQLPEREEALTEIENTTKYQKFATETQQGSSDRKLLQEAVQENMKHKTTTPADTIQQTNNIQDEESMDVEGGNPCTYWSYSGRSMAEMQAHLKKHHICHCGKCDMKFLTKQSLEAHMEKHKKKPVAGYIWGIASICNGLSLTALN